jgi:hypothetical protein
MLTAHSRRDYIHAIAFAEERAGTTVPSLCDEMRMTGNDNASEAGHGPEDGRVRGMCQIKRTVTVIAQAEAAVAALKKATGQRIDPPVMIAQKGADAPGYVTILIGKHRSAN